MSEFPAPTRSAHATFCEKDGWDEAQTARGKSVGHHVTYMKALDDGRILRTRISKPVNGDGYSKTMWHHILSQQLEVTEEAFFACVKDSILPQRGAAEPELTNPLPLSLVNLLERLLGMDPKDAGKLTVDEANQLMADYWERRASDGQ